ncbi:hypothetical protein IQ07DRAFT_137600 [Pyrenochaeta sp. DS3sAY3a]|nr:hypothetical protein IQ07DRAFT_137600 [Pyrenochaeta sp. DS3sAY3a]
MEFDELRRVLQTKPEAVKKTNEANILVLEGALKAFSAQQKQLIDVQEAMKIVYNGCAAIDTQVLGTTRRTKGIYSKSVPPMLDLTKIHNQLCDLMYIIRPVLDRCTHSNEAEPIQPHVSSLKKMVDSERDAIKPSMLSLLPSDQKAIITKLADIEMKVKVLDSELEVSKKNEQEWKSQLEASQQRDEYSNAHAPLRAYNMKNKDLVKRLQESQNSEQELKAQLATFKDIDEDSDAYVPVQGQWGQKMKKKHLIRQLRESKRRESKLNTNIEALMKREDSLKALVQAGKESEHELKTQLKALREKEGEMSAQLDASKKLDEELLAELQSANGGSLRGQLQTLQKREAELKEQLEISMATQDQLDDALFESQQKEQALDAYEERVRDIESELSACKLLEASANAKLAQAEETTIQSNEKVKAAEERAVAAEERASQVEQKLTWAKKKVGSIKDFMVLLDRKMEE